jgi:Family of unknown function (DUF6152)
MERQLAGLLVAFALVVTGGHAGAHHSYAMFDKENQIELEGVVQEFKFTNPHTFIYLAVKQDDGSTVTWNLEGLSPSGLVRDGWTGKTLKPGDEIKVKIAPLRSGAPGGAWSASQISFRDGRPIEVNRSTESLPSPADPPR